MDLAQTLVEFNPDGVIGFDREYRYTIWNPAMERISGLPRKKVLGRVAFDVFPFLRETGEDRYFVAALSGRRAVSRERPYHVPETGSTGYFDGHYFPLRDEHGAVVGGLALIRDVTARREAEGRARESRELFESYMAHIPGVAFVKDSEGRHVFANRLFEQTHGLRPGEWRGKLDMDIFPPATAHRFRNHDLEVLAGGQPVRMIDQQGARNEPEHWMWVKFPIRDASGRQLVAGLAFNITDQYRSEQALRASEERFRQLSAQLQEVNRRKDEFLATLGHELRNPLAPLLTAAEIIRVRPEPDPAAGRAREVIARQAERMRRLIDDLLDVARIERGIVSLHIEPFDLREAVQEAVRTGQSWAEAREQTVRLTLPDDPVAVDGDPVRMEQVITNLLSNASKFTPSRGRIEVSVERSDGAAVVRVADTGKGIPSDMLSRVFELFTQVNPSLDRAEGGLGVGLTLVKRLTEMHGGTVSVSSAGEDRGTVVEVRLPLSLPVAESTDAAPIPAAPSDGTQGEPCRVLIVDDNVESAEMLSLLLPDWGYDTATAYSGPQAIERALAFAPRIVLLDIGLPGMDGFEVAQRFRSNPSLREIRLVALTGYGQEDDRRRTRELGFADHLTKPVDMESLRALLASLSVRR